MVTYVKLTIDGTQYTDFEKCSVQRSVATNNESARVTIVFDNTNGLYASTFSSGQAVSILAEKGVDPPTVQVFGGIVTDVQYSGRGSVRETVSLTCRDYTFLLQQKTVEPEVYTNQTIAR